MKKPMPPPPFSQTRGPKRTASEIEDDPFNAPVLVTHDQHPELKDDAVRLIFKSHLTREHQDDPKVLLFILKYVACRNVSQAAREAGLKNGNYWRNKPDIHSAIDAITSRQQIKYGYDGHEIVERAKEIVDVDMIDFQNADGTWKDNLNDVRPEARRAVRKFEVKNLFASDVNGVRTVVGKLIKVEFWDKMKGIELLGPEKNVMKKTSVVQHDVTANMKDVLLESGNRAEERLRLMEARRVEDAEGKSGQSSAEWSDDGVSVGESGGGGPWDRSSATVLIGPGEGSETGD